MTERWTEHDRWEYADNWWAGRCDRIKETRPLARHMTVCPVCGAPAEIVSNYLGGYGAHPAAFCDVDPTHRTPLIWKDGRFVAGAYFHRRFGHSEDYRIVTPHELRLLEAQARCQDLSSLYAAMNGGEPWEYEPPMPETDPPCMIEADATDEQKRRQAAERSYLAIPTTARLSENVKGRV